MVLPASGPISIGQIADEFGIPRTTPFGSGFWGLGGAPASGPLKVSDFYGRSKPTPTPTPAPSFLTAPAITPTTGAPGTTQYAIADPSVANGAITAREFIQGGTVIGGGNSITPGAAGDMYWRATATGPGGTTYFTSNVVAVVAPPPSVVFDPNGGYVTDTNFYSAGVFLSCSQDAVWTYSTTYGFGGVVNIGSGGVSRNITFSVDAGGSGPNRRTRQQVWSVRAEAGGAFREYTVDVTALGDDNQT